jgi:AraC-like DNA-binding protein
MCTNELAKKLTIYRQNQTGAARAKSESAPRRIDTLDEEITVSSWDGRLREDLTFQGACEPAFCIGVLVEGGARMAFDGGAALELRTGMAVLQSNALPASGRDVIRGAAATRLVDIRFTPAYLQRTCGCALPTLDTCLISNCSLPGQRVFLGSICAPNTLLRIASDILALDGGHDSVRKLYLKAKAMEALAVILPRLLGEQHAPIAVAAADRCKLMAARKLLDQRYAHAWTVARVAAQAGLNEKRLQAGFRSLFGMTVHTYLMQTRIDAAAERLSRGATVTDTAYAVGFSSLSHFSKIFRAAMGSGPKEWSMRCPSAPPTGSPTPRA